MKAITQRAAAWMAVGVLSTVCPLAAEQVQVEFAFYRVRGDVSGETSLTDNLWDGIQGEKLEATKGRFTFFTLADLKVGDLQFAARESGWTWSGKEEPPSAGKVEKLAEPRVLNLIGRGFELSLTSSQPIEYFERRADGLFEHRVADEMAGMSIAARLERGVNGRITLRKLTLETKTVSERRPLEGVGLPVGSPVFTSDSLETTVSLLPDRAYGIWIRTQKEGLLFVRLRVRVMEEPGR